jgi:hypothetical protein
MLEQIFGSKTRVQIINLFVRNPETGFYVREIARISGQYINSIRRELANLERFGLLKSKNKIRKKFYYIDNSFFLIEEIKNFFLKADVFLENDLTNALKEIGDVKLLVFTGSFTGVETKTDLLIVGDKIKLKQLRRILENFGLTAGQEVKYTIFDTKEYEYRQGISDHFIQNIFDQKNIVVVDKL